MNPDTSARQVSFRVFDGVDSSIVFTRIIAITSVNLPPEIVDNNNDPIDTLYVSMDEDTPLEVCLDALDPDGDVVKITTGISKNNDVNIQDDSPDDFCFNLHPVANFFGTDTLEVIFCDQGTPAKCDSLIIIASVAPINDIPIVFGNPTQLQYTEGDGAVRIDSTAGVFDIDDVFMEGATISIANNYLDSEDLLSFNNQNGITGSYDASTGTLTISGTASVENYIKSLASITYENTNANADPSTRRVDFRVFDGTDSSDVHSRSIDFISENFPPEIVDENGLSLDTLYISTEEDTSIELCIDAIDPDDDLLYISGLLPLSGTFNFNVSSITDLCLNLTPDVNYYGTDIFQLNVCDQGEPSECDSIVVVAEVVPVNDPPILTGSTSILTYTEGDGLVVIDPEIIITDVDDTSIDATEIKISTNFKMDEDALSFNNQNGINGTYESSSGILMLAGIASLSEYISALASIVYSNNSVNPNLSVRQVSFRVFDGVDSSNVFTRDIKLTSINLPPEIVDDNENPIDTLYIILEEDIPMDICLDYIDPDEDNVVISSGYSYSEFVNFEDDISGDLCFSLVPSLNFYGMDTLWIQACDDGTPSLCDILIIVVLLYEVKKLDLKEAINLVNTLLYSILEL